MTTPLDLSPAPASQAVLDQMQDIFDDGEAARRARRAARLAPPRIRIWDGNWDYIGALHDVISASFQWKLNDTGVAAISLPHTHPIGKWIADTGSRSTKNVHLTMDKDGARWSGRLSSCEVQLSESGERTIELTFLHDYEELKHLYCWPNPFLPAAVQFPRVFITTGPTAYVLKLMLLLNFRRLFGSRARLNRDPLDFTGSSAFDGWPVVVAPGRFEDDSSPWILASSRMKNWHDLAKTKLSEAQLTVKCRRFLEGDRPPWAGAQLRHGTLVVDIVDTSGLWQSQGTALTGDIFTGITRTVQTIANDLVTMDKAEAPRLGSLPEYQVPGRLGTDPAAPYVIYREGPLTGVTASSWAWHPASATQVVVGGHSPYGVNEGISMAVQAIGNILGTFVFLPTAGTIADTLLRPLYQDTLLAWMAISSSSRKREAGWSHYGEHFAEGADKAYSLSAIAAIREGFWKTREHFTHRLSVADGAPWFVGDEGQGHFFLGDRIGAQITGLPEGQFIVEQVTELKYQLSRSEVGWQITCGDPRSDASPLEKVLHEIRDAAGTLHDLGVI